MSEGRDLLKFRYGGVAAELRVDLCGAALVVGLAGLFMLTILAQILATLLLMGCER